MTAAEHAKVWRNTHTHLSLMAQNPGSYGVNRELMLVLALFVSTVATEYELAAKEGK